MSRRPRAVTLSLCSLRRRPIVVIRRKRRTIPRPLALHLRDLRIGNFQSVLDGIASAIQRALKTDSVVRMARHFLLPTVRLVDNGLQLFYRQGRLRYKLALFVHPGAVRHVDLEPVRSMLELLAGGPSRFPPPLPHLRALGALPLRRLCLPVVSPPRAEF